MAAEPIGGYHKTQDEDQEGLSQAKPSDEVDAFLNTRAAQGQNTPLLSSEGLPGDAQRPVVVVVEPAYQCCVPGCSHPSNIKCTRCRRFVCQGHRQSQLGFCFVPFLIICIWRCQTDYACPECCAAIKRQNWLQIVVWILVLIMLIFLASY